MQMVVYLPEDGINEKLAIRSMSENDFLCNLLHGNYELP